MSWTREHIARLAALQLETRLAIKDAGTDAPGVDWLIEANECLSNAQDHAIEQVERREQRHPRHAAPDGAEPANEFPVTCR